jgi:hypothetical protein
MPHIHAQCEDVVVELSGPTRNARELLNGKRNGSAEKTQDTVCGTASTASTTILGALSGARLPRYVASAPFQRATYRPCRPQGSPQSGGPDFSPKQWGSCSYVNARRACPSNLGRPVESQPPNRFTVFRLSIA